MRDLNEINRPNFIFIVVKTNLCNSLKGERDKDSDLERKIGLMYPRFA
jgi:hypothetical protein